MSETSALGGNNPVQNSCWNKVIESKWTDAALITGFVALLVIGILASTGVFNFMGTTNAAHLSYGMYGGAALLLIAEIVKRGIVSCSNNASPDDIDEDSPVPYNYTNPSAKRSEPLTQETVQDLKQQAATYASTNARSDPWATKEQATERLQNYILKIIDKPEFQKDPVAYMEAWLKERGGRHNHIIPDDDARSFLNKALQQLH